MPGKDDYKKEVNNALKIKPAKDFPQDKINFVNKIHEEIGGDFGNWRELLERKSSEKWEEIQNLQNDLVREREFCKEESIKKQKDDLVSKKLQLEGQIMAFKLRTEEERRQNEDDLKEYERKLADVNKVLDAAKEGNAAKYGDYEFYPSNFQDSQDCKDIEKKLDEKYKSYDELKKYGEIREELEEYTKSKAPYQKVVSDYKEAKQSFDNLSGAQKFFGKLLPAFFGYGPSKLYLQITSYEEAFRENNVKPEDLMVNDAGGQPLADQDDKTPMPELEEELNKGEKTFVTGEKEPGMIKETEKVTEVSPEVGGGVE